MTFTLAWVNEGDAFVSRNDEDVFSFDLTQIEGEFATLKVEIKNPRVGLLKAGRNVWCWFGNNGTALFHGRLVGIPSNVTEEVVALDFVARPSNFMERKEATAATMRALPYFDPVWITKERRADPDAVLEARPTLWHTDRVTHAVTASNITSGEDGTIDIDTNFFADSISITYTSAPVKKVRVEASVQWTQLGTGVIDITNRITSAFVAANSDRYGKIASFTGTGLVSDWPKTGSSIGSGWSFGPVTVAITDLNAINQDFLRTTLIDATTKVTYYCQWPLYHIAQSTTVAYDAKRTRIENISFDLSCDVQPILTEPGDEEYILITLSSEDIDQPIDVNGTKPIVDPRRPYYLTTDRGRKSVGYLISLARARMLARARAIQIDIETDFSRGLNISCRKNVRIADGRLPGGEAIGKVSGYTLYLNGDTGESGAKVTLGCMIGKGTSVTPTAGDPVWADNYVGLGYQEIEGGSLLFTSSDVVYSAPVRVSDDYDGLDLFNMNAFNTIQSLAVYNGWPDQQDVLLQAWGSTSDVQAAISQTPTYVDLTMKPVRGGPYTATYQMTVQPMAVSKTIDMEAS